MRDSSSPSSCSASPRARLDAGGCSRLLVIGGPLALSRKGCPGSQGLCDVWLEQLWQLAALASLSSARGTPRRFTLQSSDDCVGISIFSLALRQRPKTGQPSSLGEMIELSTSNILSSGALKDEADLTDAFVLRALPVLCVFSLEAWVQPTPPTESRHLGTVRRLVNRGHALGLAYRRGPGGPKIR